MHPHIFDNLLAGVIIPKPEEMKEVSVILFHKKAVKHLFNVSGHSYWLSSEMQ